MPSIPFTIADVFSTTPYKGNPLAIVDARTQDLSDTQMKLITRQFNLSETTFFFPPTSPQADFKLRSFLPDGKEVFGAGHNILGVWWHLAQSGLLNLSAPSSTSNDDTQDFTFYQELGGDVIPVKITRHHSHSPSPSSSQISVAIRQARPQAHGEHPDPAALATSLGLTVDDIGFISKSTSTKRLPPQVMSTSTTHHLLVPVSSVEALNKVEVQRDRLLQQIKLADAKAYGLYLFTPVVSDNNGTLTFQARFFSPGMSGEDPATGSAAGPLSAYLYKHGVLKLEDGVGRIVVQQGLRVGRECVIRVELSATRDGSEDVVEVDVIGGGVNVAEGRISIPDASTVF